MNCSELRKFAVIRNIKKKRKFLNLRENLKKRIPEEKNQQDARKPLSELVVNQSSINFSQEELELLSKGLNHKLVPSKPLLDQIIVNIETGMENFEIDNDEKTVIRQELRKVFRTNARPKPDMQVQRTLRELRSKPVYFMKADKGKSIVILDKVDYDQRMFQALEDGPFAKVKTDKRWKDGVPLNMLSTNVDNCLKKLVQERDFNHFIASSLIVHNPKLPVIYGLPKIHKTGKQMRIISSSLYEPTSKVSDFVLKKFKQIDYKSPFSVANSVELCSRLKNVRINSDEILISFDVKSLFPSIMKQHVISELETLLNSQLMDNNEKDIYIEMIKLVLSQNYSTFRDQTYQQTDGLSIGNKLSPMLSELFMKRFEDDIKDATWFPRVWIRYIDDIFAIVKKDQLEEVFNNLNSTQYTNIQFTKEIEVDGKLPFLDILIKREGSDLKFSIYRKPTDSQQYINATSFHSIQHKHASLNFLIHRLMSIPMMKEDFEEEWKNILKIAEFNGFSEKVCESILYNKTKKLRLSLITSLSQESNVGKNFISVPFYPPITNRLTNILKKRDITLSFSNPNKLGNLIGSSKDKIRDHKKKSGIYLLECENCNCSYIGQTRRTLEVRENEHKNLNGGSVVAKHLRDEQHKLKDIQLLREERNFVKLDVWESYYLFKYRHRNLLNEKKFGNNPSSLYGFG